MEKKKELIWKPVKMVDLGLPSGTLWASRNIGAEKETAPGLFANFNTLYGLQAPDESRYFNVVASEYNVQYYPMPDLFKALGPYVHCIPSVDDFRELDECCYWQPVAKECSGGYKVMSRMNGNYIYLPAGGWYGDAGHQEGEKIEAKYDAIEMTTHQRYYLIVNHEKAHHRGQGTEGRYLTCNYDSKWAPLGWNGGACCLSFDNHDARVSTMPRNAWGTIRPVFRTK